MDGFDDDQWLRVPYKARVPTPEQIGAFLTALMLAGPALMGGMAVLPVTYYEDRRRQQEMIVQESSSSVGTYQSAEEAHTGLVLSQQRLAVVTREVEHTTQRVVTEADVVNAAHKVLAGEVSPRKGQRFRSALGRVANDSVDYYILRDDYQAMTEERDEPIDYETDPEGWVESFA
jgi:hypothetical protein